MHYKRRTTAATGLSAVLWSMYPPGAFSSSTGIFQTSGSRDRSRVSSSSRQVSSWESRKHNVVTLNASLRTHECHTRHSHQTSICPPPLTGMEKSPLWICLTSLVLFIYKLRTNNRHFIIISIKKNQLADLFDFFSPYYRKLLL